MLLKGKLRLISLVLNIRLPAVACKSSDMNIKLAT